MISISLQARENQQKQLEAAILSSHDQMVQRERDLEGIRTESAGWQHTIASLSAQLQKAGNDNLATAETLAQQQEVHAAQQARLEHLHSSQAALTVSLREAQQKREHVHLTLQAMEAEHSRNQEQIQELHSEASETASQLRSLHMELNDMQLRLAESETAVKSKLDLDDQIKIADQKAASLVRASGTMLTPCRDLLTKFLWIILSMRQVRAGWWLPRALSNACRSGRRLSVYGHQLHIVICTCTMRRTF